MIRSLASVSHFSTIPLLQHEMNMAPSSDRYDNVSRYESSSVSSFPLNDQHFDMNGHNNGGMVSFEAKLEQFRKSDGERDAMLRVRRWSEAECS